MRTWNGEGMGRRRGFRRDRVWKRTGEMAGWPDNDYKSATDRGEEVRNISIG